MEIKTSKELGRKGWNKYMWASCVCCGRERWVRLIHGKPAYEYCPKCVRQGRVVGSGKGWKKNGDGYILVQVLPDSFFYSMANIDGYVLEHRLVMAMHLKRCLHAWEVVHHKDGIKDHNTISNLELTQGVGDHIREHSRGYRDGYQQGLLDGRSKQIQELKDLIENQTVHIKLLEFQIQEATMNRIT